MSEEILINVTPQETRVAIVENGLLQEVQVERVGKQGLVGNIFKGCVSKVMPALVPRLSIRAAQGGLSHARRRHTCPGLRAGPLAGDPDEGLQPSRTSPRSPAP